MFANETFWVGMIKTGLALGLTILVINSVIRYYFYKKYTKKWRGTNED